MAYQISENGLRKIAGEEGQVKRGGLHVLYNDPVGHATIGWGHLVHYGPIDGSEPEEFKRGLTDEQALALKKQDAQRFVKALNRLVTVPLSQNQVDALISLMFNIGEGGGGEKNPGFEESTVRRLLNQRDYQGAADAFLMWKYAGGQPILLNRRKRERALFLTPDNAQESPVAGLDNLHPVFAQRVANACRARGTSVYSGARSTIRQGQLYQDYLAGRGNPANPPGTSWHEYGEGMKGGRWALAVDFAEPYPHGEPGLVFPIRGEPWHAQPSEIPESARVAGAENRLPSIAPDPQPEEPEVSKIAYPLQVDAGERRRLPIVAIGGGFGWTRASVTFASTGVEVRKAVVGPNVRPIEHLDPGVNATSKVFDGRWYVDLRAGDEWIEVELGTGEGAGTLDLYVEAADA